MDKDLATYRWSLALGNPVEEIVDADELQAHQVLNQLYNDKQKQSLQRSMPKLHKWNARLQQTFPTNVVELVQKDAIHKYELRKLLLDEQYLETVKPNIGLLSNLLVLKKYFRKSTLTGLQRLIERMAATITKKLRPEIIRALGHSYSRSKRLYRLKSAKIDWERTLAQNLQYYEQSIEMIIPRKFYGQRRTTKKIKRLYIVVDQSASMADSLIYASLYASILSKVPSLQTTFVVFDTEVVDLTDYLEDVVELIMQTQLGGGTNIAKALTYTIDRIDVPEESVVILISDLFDGYDDEMVYHKIRQLKDKGTNVVCLLALNDEGTPTYNQALAHNLRQLGVECFACSLDLFPTMMAQALNGEAIKV